MSLLAGGRLGVSSLVDDDQICICTCRLLAHQRRVLPACAAAAPLWEAVETAKQIWCSDPWRECSGCSFLLYTGNLARNISQPGYLLSELKMGSGSDARGPLVERFQPWLIQYSISDSAGASARVTRDRPAFTRQVHTWRLCSDHNMDQTTRLSMQKNLKRSS